ncbi:MAG TPA: redoxin domain-containing protein [Candidatus Andersenbacteria bacterium]|nr:redoxin domain-containing protein [Candidatus Andersenbacteria bacterium]
MKELSPLQRNSILGVVIVLIAGSIWYLESIQSHHGASGPGAPIPIASNVTTSDRSNIIAQKTKQYQRAVDFANPSGFVNSDPFHIQDLIGKKVILIDFWTYSCINCQRTLPYLTAWYDKYKDQGLEIIGVHTPEFQFEHDINNVKAATQKFGIKYPVVLDNDYGTWNAYQNLYWPREYLIDIDGFIVHDHAGEGDYDVTERAIQNALKERAQVLHLQENIASDMANPSNVILLNPTQVGSPETYFGAARNEFFGNGIHNKTGLMQLSSPSSLDQNTFYLDGSWNVQQEYAENQSANASISYRYQAKHVYFVAGSSQANSVQIYRDGVLVKTISIQANQLYSLIDETDSGAHTLKLIIQNPGLQAYTFTFG